MLSGVCDILHCAVLQKIHQKIEQFTKKNKHGRFTKKKVEHGKFTKKKLEILI
jgi:hypothetical protein